MAPDISGLQLRIFNPNDPDAEQGILLDSAGHLQVDVLSTASVTPQYAYGTYTTAQTDTVLAAIGSGSYAYITGIYISAEGDVTVTLEFDAGTDVPFFKIDCTTNSGVCFCPLTPIKGGDGQDILITTSGAVNVHTTVTYYEDTS